MKVREVGMRGELWKCEGSVSTGGSLAVTNTGGEKERERERERVRVCHQYSDK